MLEEFAAAVREAKTPRELGRARDDYQKRFKELLPKLTEKDWPACEDMIVAVLEKGHIWMIEEYVSAVLEKRKLIDWKKRTDVIDKLMRTFLENVARKDEFSRNYCKFIGSIVKVIKNNRLMKQFQSIFLDIMEKSLTTYSHDYEHPIHSAAMNLATEYPWKDDVKGLKQTFKLVSQTVQAHPEVAHGQWLCTSTSLMAVMMCQSVAVSTANAPHILDEITETMYFCKDQEWHADGDKHTLAYEMLKNILECYLNRHFKQTDLMKPNMAVVKELWECGDETLERDANNIMKCVADNIELVGDNTDQLIERYLNGEDPTLITSFNSLYNKCPEKFNCRLNEFIEMMDRQEEWQTLSSLNFFWEIAKMDASLFTQSHLDALGKQLQGNTSTAIAFMVLQCIAEKRPRELVKFDDDVISAMTRLGQNGFNGGSLLVAFAKCGKKQGRKYIKYLMTVVPTVQSMYKLGLLHNIRSIGQLYPGTLDEYKSDFELMKKEPALVDSCRSILDIIEGRSLEGVSKDVEGAKQDIVELDDRVSTTEQNVENVSREVDGTKKNIRHIQEDVTKVEGRVDELEEVVDETVDKVEEIDRKTLSHAPAWSRDVSLLMNPEREHDWRLLASRLGYTAEDVRNWATQPDPCLSLLDEWFATHKTREATYAVLKGLQEMNRMDAAAIVDKALANVEDVIDEEPEELLEPPPVFISYQWGHQPEAKLLKRHLEMAGFKAWMDIGQMGGGDKLFAKIDQGIRAAKVVICCVSTKYAESPNCNREVNLSVTLGKPIIPLLMENLSWPPPGAMGPIFGEYLFIRFFARNGEESGDERYWPVPKFQELLMQLRYSIVPEDQLITQEYKGWWDPPEDVIVIKPKDEKEEPKTVKSGDSDHQKVKPSSPDIFISYQWGKQPQIKKLYGRLTSLGLSCWLDIMQMGGGDSLYDKIDKGVRGCKVVLTCVTTKYSISANCRREVSLADALKKPIVPLLLEKMAWPPEGPMGMVLTQLLYINFCKPDADIQNHWECPQFKELLSQIQFNVPQIVQQDVMPTGQVQPPEGDSRQEATQNTKSLGKSAAVNWNNETKEGEKADKSKNAKDGKQSHGKTATEKHKAGTKPKGRSNALEELGVTSDSAAVDHTAGEVEGNHSQGLVFESAEDNHVTSDKPMGHQPPGSAERHPDDVSLSHVVAVNKSTCCVLQ